MKTEFGMTNPIHTARGIRLAQDALEGRDRDARSFGQVACWKHPACATTDAIALVDLVHRTRIPNQGTIP